MEKIEEGRELPRKWGGDKEQWGRFWLLRFLMFINSALRCWLPGRWAPRRSPLSVWREGSRPFTLGRRLPRRWAPRRSLSACGREGSHPFTLGRILLSYFNYKSSFPRKRWTLTCLLSFLPHSILCDLCWVFYRKNFDFEMKYGLGLTYDKELKTFIIVALSKRIINCILDTSHHGKLQRGVW